MPNYSYATLKSDTNSGIKGKIGILTDPRSTINQAVRQVQAEIDLLTTRRRAPLTPNLFSGVFEYACPTDIKGYSVITILDQTYRHSRPWGLVPFEQFMRRQDTHTIAISDYDGFRKVFLNAAVNDAKSIIGNFNSIGTWVLFGDAENLNIDKDNYVTENGSLSFDISSAGGLTAGIQNSSFGSIDLTEYLKGNGTVTCWAYIVSTTGLTNYIFRIGSDSSNYYQKIITSQSDGTAFVVGWNLLRFDLTSLTTVGTPVITTCIYSALYMTKAGSKISEVGYKFDDLVLHRGEINNIYYYSNYGWQTIAGVYMENSTADSDLLNAGSEEYELIKCKCRELAADEVDEEKVSAKEAAKYKELKKSYINSNPSESLVMISQVVDFLRL